MEDPLPSQKRNQASSLLQILQAICKIGSQGKGKAQVCYRRLNAMAL